MTAKEFENQIYFNKILTTTGFIINKLKPIRNVDFIYFFKILYFAEKEHLLKYGRPILDGKYCAIKNGPIHSLIYDLFRDIRDDRAKPEAYTDFYNSFSVYENHYVDITDDSKIDMDYLSESDIEAIQLSINKYGNWDSGSLSEESHDKAWHRAYHSGNSEMNFEEIAEVAGANAASIEVLSYNRSLQHSELKLV